jgi:hypothetical protein
MMTADANESPLQEVNLMCRRFSAWLYRVSASWLAVLAMFLFLAFSIIFLPGQSEEALAISGGAGTPDLSLVYSRARLYSMAEAYGLEGRQAYVRARFSFDLAFPLVFTFFLTTAVSFLFGRVMDPAGTLRPPEGWRLLNLVPILGGLFDYGENISTSLVMTRYPARTPVVDMLAPLFTTLKWLSVGASFVLLIAGVVALLLKWLHRRDRS